MLVLRGEFGLAKKPRPTFDNSPALPESLPDFNGCPSVNHSMKADTWKIIYNNIDLQEIIQKNADKWH